MPKVSVIVPCFNVEKYISACLESLINQKLKDIEILCINDHSTDETLSILKKYELQYSDKIKVLNLENKRGCSAARNLGLKEAQGEYIGFVDADDLISLNMYLDFYYLAKAYKIEIVSGEMELFDGQMREIEPNLNPEIQVYSINKNKETLLYEIPSCCHRLFKHELLENEHFLEGKKYEDVAFTLPLLIKANKILRIKEKTYFYRMNPEGIMSNTQKPNPNILDIIDDLQFLRNRVTEMQLMSEYKEIINELEKKFLLATGSYILNWPISEEKKKYFISLFLEISRYFNPEISKPNHLYTKDLLKNLQNYLIQVAIKKDEKAMRQEFQSLCLKL